MMSKHEKPDDLDGELQELINGESAKIEESERKAQLCEQYAELIHGLLNDPDAIGIVGEIPIGYAAEDLLPKLAGRFPEKFDPVVKVLEKLIDDGHDEHKPLETVMEGLYRSAEQLRRKSG